MSIVRTVVETGKLFAFRDDALTPHLGFPFALELLMSCLEHEAQRLMRDAEALSRPRNDAALFCQRPLNKPRLIFRDRFGQGEILV